MDNLPHLKTPRYLKETEVSAITGLALQTIRNHRFNGVGIPYIKMLPGRAVRYSLADIIEWMESRKIHPKGAH
jgi:predicted DNA-binding transcriptional regulator AlpA